MSRMTIDIETLSQTMNSSFIQFTTSIVTLLGTFSVMLYLSPLLTFLTALIIPILIVSVRFITNRTGPLYKMRQRRRSEEHTSELQSRGHLVCRLLLEKKKSMNKQICRSS